MEDKNLWWYKKTYQDLVDSRRFRGTKRKRKDGLNKHHIIPRCMGGKDEDSNYVLLTYREHIIAHMLLARIYKDNAELSHTVYMMFNSGHKINPNIHISTRILEEYRLKSIEYLSIKNTGKHPTEEAREKMRQAKLGTKASEETRALLSEIRQNHPVSNETRDKISNSRLEMEFTEEHCKNISESKKGFKHSQETINSISGGNAFNAISIIDTNTGKEYSSITEVAKDLNLSHGTIDYRLRKGTFGLIKKDNKPKKKSKRIQGPDNTIYESIHEAQRLTGRSRSTIRGWLRNPKMNWKYLE